MNETYSTLFDGEHLKNGNLKRCRTCKIEKPTSEFNRHTHYRDNLESRCKQCCTEYNRSQRVRTRNPPPKPSDGLCECCRQRPESYDPPRKWCFDHDHKTGLFRGWLCDTCNLSIGQLGDNIEGLTNALNYLKNSTKDRKSPLFDEPKRDTE